MRNKENTVLENYLYLLKFKKFMILHVVGFTCFLIMCIYLIVISLFAGDFLEALGFFVAILFTYIFLRVFQFLWITKGADDNYFYFFKGKSKEK
ncbi:hypothetical protein [Sporosalibacterium faouarense]|uniref:hypothetical protein n=1 Tax=Sporosalibacterium faouarense TaxID=516123 RepID=UPI00192AC4E4|nr:hypothetical protein [Sporosalibacterium faouarense]